MSAKTKSFRGKVGGVTYADPTLFETAARALGFHGYGRRTPKWKVGTPVCVTFNDGTTSAGQVWSQTDVRNYAWLALDSSRFVAVFMPTGDVSERPSSRERVGRVGSR